MKKISALMLSIYFDITNKIKRYHSISILLTLNCKYVGKSGFTCHTCDTPPTYSSVTIFNNSSSSSYISVYFIMISLFPFQIGLTMEEMRCVTVSSDVPGVVRRVSGSCSGDSVTLNVALAHHFTVRIYS